MGITIQEESGNVRTLQVTGVLNKSELDAVQAAEVKKLKQDQITNIKVLIIAEDFKGWQGGVDWGDMSFYAEHGDKIKKIAIVGDPKREADWIMFMGGGIRPAPVKYFPPDQLEQARAWLRG